MKLLKKLRLINWHYFLNSKVDFGKINFLTGENAAGKSTLIDAMQVVLLGDTSGRTFNKAANEKAGRTLKGYLRGEVGDNEDGTTKFLRNGRFTSYIAMEFFDDVLNSSFTIGIVFDVYDDGSEEHKFFFLNDGFPENDFCQLNVPMSQKQLLEFFNLNYKKNDFMFCDTNMQYQNMLKEKFGNLKDKYFSLFKKAVSFIPITNIEQFITEYVCDVPNEINIESMKANIGAYERLKLEADDMEVKIKSLEEISRIYQEILDRRNEQKLASYISKRISYQFNLNRINDLQNDIQVNENRINEIDNALIEIEANLNEFNLTKEKLIGYKVSSDSYKMVADMQKTYEDQKRNIESIETKVNSLYSRLSGTIDNFDNTANKISIICEEIAKFDLDEDILSTCEDLKTSSTNVKEVCKEFKHQLTNKNDLSIEGFTAFAQGISSFHLVVTESLGLIKTRLANYISSYTQKKQQISGGAGKAYDYNFIQVKNQLAHALEDHFHEKVEVKIYADLVDIKSQKWVKAIEGFIASQKLNMFVEDKYYQAANKILPEIMRRNRYYRTGLVDSAKLYEQHFSRDPNSVAEEIITNHQGARDYTNFLLGRIIKCDTFIEARESGRGLCPDCTGYRNFASFVIPEANYTYSLIGRQMSSESKKERELQLQHEARIIDTLRTLVDTLTYAGRIEVMSTSEVDSLKQIIEEGAILPQLKNNLMTLKRDLEEGVSQEVNITDNKIKRINEDIHALEDEKSSLILEKGNLQGSISQIKEEKIPEQISLSNKYIEEIKNEFDDTWVNETGLPTFNNEVASGYSLSDIREKYNEIYAKSQNKMRSIMSIFNELRKDYIVTYKLSFDISKEDNDDFENELTTLRDVKLPQYRIKIEDARQKATKEFRDDFIFKLKTSIEQVRTQIDELNEALKDAKFGQDSYEFTVNPNPQYIDYYNMITDELLLQADASEEEFIAKHQDIMDNLFRMIGDGSEGKDKSSVIAQNVEKFTDYRTYLLFDLRVKKQDGRSYSLARNIKKASGGETQTPFYISILASFSQLYRVKASSSISNCTRLVVFDEAFSKMDRNRIIESIRILKEFDLQVILSAPPEKINDISKIVDQTLVVTRHNNRSFIDPYKIKDKEAI